VRYKHRNVQTEIRGFVATLNAPARGGYMWWRPVWWGTDSLAFWNADIRLAVFNWIVQQPALAKFWPGILLLQNELVSFFLHTNQCDWQSQCAGQVLVRKCTGREYLLGNLPQNLQTLKPPHINMQEIWSLVLELFFCNQKSYHHTNLSSL